MPFQSPRQLRFMFSQHPEIAKRWAKENPANAKMMASGPRPRKRSRPLPRKRASGRGPALGQAMPPTGGGVASGVVGNVQP